jgi:hypothetical protein
LEIDLRFNSYVDQQADQQKNAVEYASPWRQGSKRVCLLLKPLIAASGIFTDRIVMHRMKIQPLLWMA